MNDQEKHFDLTPEEHTGFIKTPKQLIITVILAFLIPITVIFMLVNLAVSGDKTNAGSDAKTPASIAERIKPVADLQVVDANAPKVFKTGQQVFDTTCTACHTAGVAGAPKLGDHATWGPLIKVGYDHLVKVALHGEGAMPPKGGDASLSDFEVERAVVYMANKSGASFKEPAEPTSDTKAQAPAAAVAPAAAIVAAAPTAPKATEPVAPKATEAAKPAADTAAAAIDPAGEKLYKSVCFACHTAGVAGAPKLGDKAAWAPLIATGLDTMVEVAIHGKNAMPPRGGSQATDAEMRAAVEYMVHAAK